MNLVFYYFKTTLKELLERYYKGGYRTMSDFRTELLNTYNCEYVRLREIQGVRMHSWEIKTKSKTYFYDYDTRLKLLKFIGVR